MTFSRIISGESKDISIDLKLKSNSSSEYEPWEKKLNLEIPIHKAVLNFPQQTILLFWSA